MPIRQEIIRQWCPACYQATPTWVDPYGFSHCSGCEPEDKWQDDDDDDWLEDEEL